MYAMQYEITLPADYDMTIIDRRIATRGPSLDDVPGLGLKAYAVRRRDGGSIVNQYAPFYLFRRAEGMSRFLLGEGFRSLCESFGRPSVRHWVGLSFDPGRAFAAVPRAATRTVQRFDAADDLSTVADDQCPAPEQRDHPDLHSSALVLDPEHWELTRFSLWRAAVPEAAGTHYEVLHVSAPEAGALAR